MTFVSQLTLAERFEQKYIPEPNSGCWLWLAGLNPAGYGIIMTGSRSDGSRGPALAHRVSYRLHHGSIPNGLGLDHLCRVRCCVNPGHLEAVPQRVNSARSELTIGTINSKKTHCPQGHEYDATSDGFFRNPAGRIAPRRVCIVCQRLWKEKRRVTNNVR